MALAEIEFAVSDRPPAGADLPVGAATANGHTTQFVVSWQTLSTAEQQRLKNEWTRLYVADPDAYVLQHPDYVLVEQSIAQPRQSMVLVGEESAGELVQLAVLVEKRIRTSRFTGIRPDWTLWGYRLAGNRVLRQSHCRSSVDGLVANVLGHVAEAHADFLLVEDLDETDPLWPVLQQHGRRGQKMFVPNAFQARLRIELPTDAVSYWAKFSSKTRSTFRRKLKKFGTNELVRVTERSQLPEFLEQATLISKETWQSRNLGLRVKNDAKEHTELGQLADMGCLRSYLWKVDGQPVAFLIGNQSQGTFHYEEVGYVTRFARFSPGQMLLLQVLDDLFAENRPARFDFGGGDAEYKRMFANSTSSSGTVWWTPASFKAQLSFAAIGAMGAAKRRAREVISWFGGATRVRQWIRYGGARSGNPTSEENNPPSDGADSPGDGSPAKHGI